MSSSQGLYDPPASHDNRTGQLQEVSSDVLVIAVVAMSSMVALGGDVGTRR